MQRTEVVVSKRYFTGASDSEPEFGSTISFNDKLIRSDIIDPSCTSFPVRGWIRDGKKTAFWMRTGVICAPKCLTHRNFGYLQHRETCVTKRMRTRTAPRTSQDRCSYLGFDRKFNCLPAKIPTLNYHLKIVRINFVNEFHMSCKNKFHFSYCDFMEIAWTSPLSILKWILTQAELYYY